MKLEKVKSVIDDYIWILNQLESIDCNQANVHSYDSRLNWSKDISFSID